MMRRLLFTLCLVSVGSHISNAQDIFEAIRENNMAMVKTLVEADPGLIGKAGPNSYTPLLFAASNNREEIAEYLILKGSDVNDVFKADYYGDTPLTFAIKSDNLNLVRLLHENGADIQYRTKLGENCLHFAAAQNRSGIAEYLIANGIDINSVKNGGLTPLHIAALMGSVDVVELLIEKGAELDTRSNDNGTPLHYAVAARNSAISDILRMNGAKDLPREFPGYCGRYLGQQTPGDEPVMFVPELFRDIYRSYGTPAFSPDGKELFFYGYFMPGVGYSRIWWMREENGRWSAPELAPFSDYTSWGPAFSPDGKRLYFASRIPVDGVSPAANDIWYVEKVNGRWGEPQNPGTPPNRNNYNEMDPQLSADGSLYFKAFGPETRGTGMYKSQVNNGIFSDPVSIDEMIDSCTVDKSLIDHIISYSFGGPRGAEISICFHRPDGTWTRPVYLGEKVHRGQGTSKGTITIDGRLFFFVQNITPHWVDASFIGDLRNEVLNSTK